MMHEAPIRSGDRVLVLVATGFIGSRLLRELVKKEVSIGLFLRNPAKASRLIPKVTDMEVVRG